MANAAVNVQGVMVVIARRTLALGCGAAVSYGVWDFPVAQTPLAALLLAYGLLLTWRPLA